MRVLIAPDKFKGTLTAAEAAEAMANGVREVRPDAEIDLCPMSDGGEGFVAALGGRRLTRTVCGPLPGRRVDAEMSMLEDGTAVIEMSSAAGLTLVPEDRRNPLDTTTYGVGELIRFAVGMECRRVVLGLGGSATCEAGIGCLQALGSPITLRDGRTVTAHDPPLCGRDLEHVAAVGRCGFVDGLHLDVGCDVTNPLFGPNGAAHVFAPQKGATPADVERLDSALRNYAAAVAPASASMSGGGAAGGIGWSLAALLNARLKPGVEIVAEHLGLLPLLADADLLITGEGCLDATSLQGKVVGHVTNQRHALHGGASLCVCGQRRGEVPLFGEVIVLAERFGTEAARRDAAGCVRQAVSAWLATTAA